MKNRFTRHLLVITALTLFLTSCTPTALIVGATAGGVVVYDKRSFRTIIDDKEIAHLAQAKIDHDASLSGKSYITTTCFNHILLLVGQAKSEQLCQHASHLVKSDPRVKRILNEVEVATPTSTSAHARDAWVTTKVKTKLLTKDGLRSTQIKVLTENNVVYLMGLVSHTQGRVAALITSTVSGVDKVVKLFEYI